MLKHLRLPHMCDACFVILLGCAVTPLWHLCEPASFAHHARRFLTLHGPRRPQLVKGFMQLYSVDQKRSQPLEAHAAAFSTLKVRDRPLASAVLGLC